MDANDGLQRVRVRISDRRRRTAVLLGLLLAVSLALRVWHALPGLDRHRFVDERYPLENIEGLLREGRWRPVNGLHPGLSYLPHAGLLKISESAFNLTGLEVFAIFDSRDDFTPTAYFLCRMLQVAFGVASLWLVFLIGRKLGGEDLGLIAALFLSATPWHIRQSVVYKADMTLVFCVVLAFLLSLRAIDKPTWSRYSAAGVAIGLALAAKFNGGPIVIPLVVGTLVTSGFAAAALLKLFVAGAVSAAVFLAFDPYAVFDPNLYLRAMARTIRVYERRAEAAGVTSRWHSIPDALGSFLSGGYFGRFVGGLGLLGLLTKLIQSTARRRRSPTAVHWLMVVSYPAAYLTLYSLTTSRPDPHNWLPMAPFVALGAAWLVQQIWISVRDRLGSDPVRRSIRTVALLLLVGAVTWPAFRFVYFNTVPTTADLAVEFLFRRFTAPTGRLVVTESELNISPRYEHLMRRLAWAYLPPSPPSNLSFGEMSDGQIYSTAPHSNPSESEPSQSQLSTAGSRNILVAAPGPFRAHGPAFVAIAHPFRHGGQRLQGRWKRSQGDPSLYEAQWDGPVASGTLISLEFELPRRNGVAEIRLDGEWIAPAAYHPHGRKVVYTTPRFPVGRDVALRLVGRARPQQFPLVVKQWRRRKPAPRLEAETPSD